MMLQTQRQIVEEDDNSPHENNCWSFILPCYRQSRKKKKNQNNTISKDQFLSSIQPTNYGESLHYQTSTIESQTKNSALRKSSVKIRERGIEDYPKHRIFQLKCKYPKNQILAKITEKSFNLVVDTNDSKQIEKKSSFTGQLHRNEIFKLYDFGIQCTCDDSWSEATPEKIAKYIAQRVKDQSLIVDLGCGIGGNTIQFALESDFVIGVEINQSKLQDAQYNTKKYQVQEKVDFVLANLLTLNSLRADVVFINPSVRQVENVDLFRDCSPNIYQLMEKILHIAPNIILQLPKNIDLNQLPALFDLHRYEFLQEKYPYDYALEIEFVIINRKIEYFIVYFGQVANIKEIEINNYLSKQLMAQGSMVDGINYADKLPWILNLAKKQLGSYKLCDLINSIMKKNGREEPILHHFLNELFHRKIISKQEIIEYGEIPVRSFSADHGLLLSIKDSLQEDNTLQEVQKIRQPQSILVQTSQDQFKLRQSKQSPVVEEMIFSPGDYSYKTEDFIDSQDIDYSGFQDSFPGQEIRDYEADLNGVVLKLTRQSTSKKN